MMEIRKNVRVPVSLTSRYRMPTTFDYVEAPCTDLSLGGMFIESEHPAERGTLLKIECDVRDQEAPILGVGRVVWRRARKGETGPTGMGVKFVKLDPTSDRIVARLVQSSDTSNLSPCEEPSEDKYIKKEGAGRERGGVTDEKPTVADGRPDRNPAAGRDGGGAVAAEDGGEKEIPGPAPVVAASPRNTLAANTLLIGLIAMAFLFAALALIYP